MGKGKFLKETTPNFTRLNFEFKFGDIEKIKVIEAVGRVLAHEVTKIVLGKYKGPAFKRGHLIKKEDVDELRNLGREHIWVLCIGEGKLHEDDAAVRLGEALAGQNVRWEGPWEGKVKFVAQKRGITKINKDGVARINKVKQVILSTVHDQIPTQAGDLLAGTKAIPLVIDEDRIKEVEEIAEKLGGVIEVNKFKKMQVGVITTGTEIYKGRIEDKFEAIADQKASLYGFELVGKVIVPDDKELIKGALERW